MGTAPDTVKRLVDRFNEQSDTIRSPDYNETLIRIDFINPMFRELGWDIDNTAGYAERYREAVHEDRVKIAGQTKAPDYSFRVGGQRKFFLEAKKPAVDIKNSWEPAYQLRRYAWTRRLWTASSFLSPTRRTLPDSKLRIITSGPCSACLKGVRRASSARSQEAIA